MLSLPQDTLSCGFEEDSRSQTSCITPCSCHSFGSIPCSPLSLHSPLGYLECSSSENPFVHGMNKSEEDLTVCRASSPALETGSLLSSGSHLPLAIDVLTLVALLVHHPTDVVLVDVRPRKDVLFVEGSDPVEVPTEEQKRNSLPASTFGMALHIRTPSSSETDKWPRTMREIELLFPDYASRLLVRQSLLIPTVILWCNESRDAALRLFESFVSADAPHVYLIAEPVDAFLDRFPHLAYSHSSRFHAGSEESALEGETSIEQTEAVVVPLDTRLNIAHRRLFTRISMELGNIDQPSQILPFLFLSGVQAAASIQIVTNLHITHILNVTKECRNYFEDRIRYQKIHWRDHPQQAILPDLDEAIDFMVEAVDSQGAVLVHCFMGYSRSAAVVVAYLIREHGYSLTEAMHLVRQSRPCVDINSGFVNQLRNYEELCVTHSHSPPHTNHETNRYIPMFSQSLRSASRTVASASLRAPSNLVDGNYLADPVHTSSSLVRSSR